MSVIEMSTLTTNTLKQHEIWFAWRGYLLLRPRRARPEPAPRHPAWIYNGRYEYAMPPQLSRAISAYIGTANGLTRPESFR
jgi:hypothetical protein